MNEEPDGEEKSYRIEAVDCAIDVLMVISSEPDLGMSEIARRVGGSRQRIFRMLKTLESRGIIEKSPDGKSYRMGYASLLIGDAARSQVDLMRIAEPLMAKLGERTGETVSLRIREGNETVCVARWEPERDIRVNAEVGRRRTMHAGSSKVFPAFMPELEREKVLSRDLPRFTNNTLTDPECLRERLKAIREAGYDVSQGEINDELVSISAPIFGAKKVIVAVLNLAAPASRMSSRAIEATIPLVVDTSRHISRLLGAPADKRSTSMASKDNR